MRAMYENGLSCPEDFSIIGFDGIEYGKYVSPKLTTQAVDQIGKRCTSILLDLINNKYNKRAKNYYINPTIYIGGSEELK